MKKTKNAAPVLVHRERQTETETFSGATTSSYQHTTQQSGGQPRKIEKLLSHGAENAIPLKHLVKLTRQPARQVRQQIQAARLRGAPILSDNERGYFLPGSKNDIDNFVRSMYHRAHEIARVANAVRLRGRRLD